MSHPDPDPRKGGRPPNAEKGTTVSIWIPTSAHDRLMQLAKQQEQSLSETAKQLLLPRL